MNPRVPTKEEGELIHEYVMLPFMMDIAKKNIEQIERTTMTFKPLYIAAAERVLNDLIKRHVQVKKELRACQIKVWEDRQAEAVIYYKYTVRGYEDKFGIMREWMISQMRVSLTEYMRKVFDH